MQGGERLGHIADRQSKYLSDGNVGVRPLRFVSLWEKLMACPQSGHYVPMLGPFDGRGRKSDGQRILSLSFSLSSSSNQLPPPFSSSLHLPLPPTSSASISPPSCRSLPLSLPFTKLSNQVCQEVSNNYGSLRWSQLGNRTYRGGSRGGGKEEGGRGVIWPVAKKRRDRRGQREAVEFDWIDGFFEISHEDKFCDL